MLTGFLPLLLLHLAGSPATPPPTTISGRLEHAPPGDTVRLELNRQRYKAPLLADGRFTLRVPDLKAPAMVHLRYAGQQTLVYLSPGDQLQVQLDFPHFDQSLRYTGRGAPANNYLAQALYRFELGPAGAVPRPPEQRNPSTTPAQLRQYADAFRKAQLAFLADYERRQPLSPAFRQLATERINLQWALQLLEYPVALQNAATLPPDYYNFLSELPRHTFDAPGVRDRGIDINTLAARGLMAYNQRLLLGRPLSADTAEVTRFYAQTRRDFHDQPTVDLAMLLLYVWRLEAEPAAVQAALPGFQRLSRDTAYVSQLRHQLFQRQKLQTGQPAPAFALRSADGRDVTLAELRGKVVYLDFWGTWCKPCLAEMPASNRLKQKFAGRDVVFVYVSVNDAEAKWRQVLAQQQLASPNSLHLQAAGSIVDDYQVTAFPSYVLIGRDGKLRLPHAPRPSDEAAATAAIEAALAP